MNSLLENPVPVNYIIVDGKRMIRKMHSAKIIRMSDTGAEVLFVPPVRATIKITGHPFQNEPYLWPSFFRP